MYPLQWPSPGEWKLGRDIGAPSDTVIAVEVDPSTLYEFPESLDTYKGVLVFESCAPDNAALIVEMHEKLRAFGKLAEGKRLMLLQDGPVATHRAEIDDSFTALLDLARVIAKLESP